MLILAWFMMQIKLDNDFWSVLFSLYIKLENCVTWRMRCLSQSLYCLFHGPLTRYVKLLVAHASGMPGTFPRHWKWPRSYHGTVRERSYHGKIRERSYHGTVRERSHNGTAREHSYNGTARERSYHGTARASEQGWHSERAKLPRHGERAKLPRHGERAKSQWHSERA